MWCLIDVNVGVFIKEEILFFSYEDLIVSNVKCFGVCDIFLIFDV